jgi:lipopolysaccharide export system protein LptA
MARSTERRRRRARSLGSVHAVVAIGVLLLVMSARAQTDGARGGGGGGGVLGSLSFTSKDEPIVVGADQLEFDYDRNRLVYRGSVHVTQGDLELECQTLTVTYDRADDLEKAQLREVVAEGSVVITQGGRRASGDRGIFDQTTRQITLLGNPVLRDGPNEVQGDRLTVYLDEGRSVIEASPKKRVSAILYPGQVGSEAGKGAPSASPTTPPAPGADAAADEKVASP